MAVTTQKSALDNVLEYVKNNLEAEEINGSLFHGDFSASNIFYQDGVANTLIDWEYGSYTGPAIIDLINVICSIDRAHSNTNIIDNALSLITEQWQYQKEREFIRRAFSMSNIRPEKYTAIVICWWFWMIDKQLDTSFVYFPNQLHDKIDNFMIEMENKLHS